MNIVLIGFASCGKSATAFELARRRSMTFIDLDRDVEALYALSRGSELHLRDIIRREGAEAFFALEHAALKSRLDADGSVFAPGGGLPMREENRALLVELGALFYLRTDPAVLLQRMQTKGLPLFLKGNDSIENLTEIWRERDKVYRSLTDRIVDNSALTIAQTADAVEALLEETAT